MKEFKGVYLCMYTTNYINKQYWLLINNPVISAIGQAEVVISCTTRLTIKDRILGNTELLAPVSFIEHVLSISTPIIFNKGESFNEKSNFKYRQ